MEYSYLKDSMLGGWGANSALVMMMLCQVLLNPAQHILDTNACLLKATIVLFAQLLDENFRAKIADALSDTEF